MRTVPIPPGTLVGIYTCRDCGHVEGEDAEVSCRRCGSTARPMFQFLVAS